MAVVALGVIVAGVRIAKTMEARETARQQVLARAQTSYVRRLDEWRASSDGQEYAQTKVQIRHLRTLGAQLLEDGRRRSHPKKRADGAALLAAAEAMDLSKLVKTMPQPPDATIVAPAVPWWTFANIVVWPALLEFLATELLVLATAFWASFAFAPLRREEDCGGRIVPNSEVTNGHGHLYVVPDPIHPVFTYVDFEALDLAIEDEPECPEAAAWEQAKQGLNLKAATWRGFPVTAGSQWTKRVGTKRRRFVWPILDDAGSRTIFIGTQTALRYLTDKHNGR